MVLAVGLACSDSALDVHWICIGRPYTVKPFLTRYCLECLALQAVHFHAPLDPLQTPSPPCHIAMPLEALGPTGTTGGAGTSSPVRICCKQTIDTWTGPASMALGMCSYFAKLNWVLPEISAARVTAGFSSLG